MCGKCGYPKNECMCKKPDYNYNCYKPMKWKDDCDYDYDHMECCMPKPKMECEKKECVKTYKVVYKLYKTCQYRLYKVCCHCGHEYDYHHHRGMCPKCSGSMMYMKD